MTPYTKDPYHIRMWTPYGYAEAIIPRGMDYAYAKLVKELMDLQIDVVVKASAPTPEKVGDAVACRYG